MTDAQIQSNHLLTMVEHLPLGAVFISSNNLTMNHAAEKITGYTRDEVTTVDQWFKVMHGNEVDTFRAIYETERAQGFPRTSEPIAITCRDGNKRFIEFTAYSYDGY